MEKKIEQAVQKTYEAPRIEVINVQVEKGFAASSGGTNTSYDDVCIDDAEDGGIPWSTLMRD